MKPKKCHYCGKRILFIPFGSPKLPRMSFCSAECEDEMLLKANKEYYKTT